MSPWFLFLPAGSLSSHPLISSESQKQPLPDFSGIDEGFAQIGLRAVKLLTSLWENFERGVPALPVSHLLSGRWHEGKTLRSLLQRSLRGSNPQPLP